MPNVSVIVPLYDCEDYVLEAVGSVLAQTYADFELIIVDDGSTDSGPALCEAIDDPRVRMLHQQNRGLAGARNSGIRAAVAPYLAFLDADDLWMPTKLERHVAHLDDRPFVGVSYSRSSFIDHQGTPLGIHQMPKLKNVSPKDVLCRNPVGNGSAPVIRREALEEIAYFDDPRGYPERFYFDETLRQSEDIECWIRMTGQTQWAFEGIPESLTLYRINEAGLSANLNKQLANWERAIRKARRYAPGLIERWGDRARAYQLRYLARRAVTMRDGKTALSFIFQALTADPGILWQEPGRSGATLASALLLQALPSNLYGRIEGFGVRMAARRHEALIQSDLNNVSL